MMNQGDSLIANLIWSAGLKATKPRVGIVKALMAKNRPASIEDIQKALPKLALGSIYRVLGSLVERGIIYRMDAGRSVLYEIIYSERHHHHIVCTGCGDIEEVELVKKCPAISMTELLPSNSKKFKSVSRHSLEFFGLCKKCS